MSLHEKDKSSKKILWDRRLVVMKVLNLMGPDTVSGRNFWNVYKFKQNSLLICGREDEIFPIFGDC